MPADRVQPTLHHGEKVVEVVRNAAGQLTDGFHFLCLPQQFFRLDAGFVLGFEFARALADAFFQRLGKGA